VATDTQGNVYITGNFSGTVIFDGTGGTDSQTSANFTTFLTKYNANGSYAYTKTVDASAGGASVSSNSVATDNLGNVYIVGYFQGTVVFDGVGGSDSQTAANQSGFITKYNANGSYAYTKTFDTSASGSSAYAFSVTTDTLGDAYVAGFFSGTVVFSGTGGTDSQTSANFTTFLTKYNANGSYAYTKTFDASASSAAARGFAVATDPLGDAYVAGYFSGTVVFDGVGGTDSQTSANDEAFLTKYNANGSYAYTKTFDTSASASAAYPSGVVADSQGNVYMTGQFSGTTVFDGTGGSDSQTSANYNSFLTSFQMFIPNPTSGSVSSKAGSTLNSSVLGAPDTGFGTHLANPARTLAIYSLIAIGLGGLSLVISKTTRQTSE
jgi:hypothetical protein